MPKIALDIPKALLPLLQPARYQVMYGGRGAGKSFTVASWLDIYGVKRPLRVLCAREYQVSIKDSVHRLLADRIEALGLSQFYTVTQTSIVGTNGTEFIFKGLHHNAQEIKSMEGVDICWVEEASSVSAESWDVLIPTIRKQGSEIWLTFNPLSPDDATWQRFVKNPPPGAWVQKVLFSDNPWFPEVLDDERRHLQEIDPELYQHVWLGEPRTISDAQVFKGRYLIQEFDTPEDARFFHGADWGFSVDPSVLIRCFIRGNVLYVDREAYGAGVELDETPQLFDSIETSRKWAIKADSARPETISYMRRQGFKIEAAKKWAGSVEDGLAILKSFDKIIIHPRCVHAADEFYKYSYKVDKNNGDVLPIVVDANNHCVAEGSLIATERGDVPIEDVTTADRVLTREGYKRVLWAGKTGENREVMKVAAVPYNCIGSDEKALICTPEHLIYTINRGFIRADALRPEDILFCDDGFRHPHTCPLAGENATVYDLSVEGQHEFFANGVLVHNCIDALRYALDGYIHRGGGMKINLANLRGR